MNIFIPVMLKEKGDVCFSENTQNPGIGGTAFTSVKLAIMLARKYPELELTLVSTQPLGLEVGSSNLKNMVFENLPDFFERYQAVKGQFLILCTMSIARTVNIEILSNLANRTLIWLHHPFQLVPEVKKLGCVAHVHVGEYQYYSNQAFYPASWYIQNPFMSSEGGTQKKFPEKKDAVKIIYLGALFRVKGFGHVARQWSAIKNVLPNAQLHVIGSSATYGKQPEHQLIPCDADFAQEILCNVPLEDIEAGKIVFHGNLGAEKFEVMRSAHFAILNPTGASEAFPASPLECMACGLPVIASDDFGMSDSMRFFPELILRNPSDIQARISFLMSNRYRYEEFSARSIAVAGWFNAQTDVILTRWRRLFDLASQQHASAIPNSPPIHSVYGPLSKLMKRQIRARIGVEKRATFSRIKKVLGRNP